MLAYNPEYAATTGVLGSDVHMPLTFLFELLDFIAAELPRWRDRPERQAEEAETRLTSQLCGHLNSASRFSAGFDILQFRPEEPDEQERVRRIDLVAAPCGVAILVEGRKYNDLETLLPIECKRLPTPEDKDRDEREYVFNQYKTTGGIQRFKAGHHAATHSVAGMIGYVQEETATFWHERTSVWIRGLSSSGVPGWTEEDLLQIENDDTSLRLMILRSSHGRNNQSKIQLRHLWINMN